MIGEIANVVGWMRGKGVEPIESVEKVDDRVEMKLGQKLCEDIFQKEEIYARDEKVIGEIS